jgi:hypothetical protein
VVEAAISQQSVISLEDFETSQTYQVERYFMRQLPENDEDADYDQLIGRTIDMATIVLEAIALDLDPYPRKPGEVFESTEESVDLPESKIKPFARLQALQSKKS